MTIEEEKVRVPSKKKYPCKKGKGEHEYLEPTILYKPSVRYSYDTRNGILDSGELEKEYEYLGATIQVALETRCKYCGHKCISFLKDKIK